ncbi:alpha/beta hydrolase [Arthrobacter sp. AQ5-05]|uniref:alpha/beta fold hydrolase n=1 Tax=Arthrobacter sp. AQ5-05 TaxID=2184581 RepID=UPI0011BF6404|nr:alpha/beta hydrolase [Arthrobacter sp. AQ5-05]
MSNLVLGAVERANIDPYGEIANIPGGMVNVSVTGEGEQTVVLLAGYGTASPVLDFKPLVTELEDAYKVIVIERFGYGFSDLDATTRTVENISTELHDTLSKLGVNDSYVLVAHSLAGIYSLDYVNRFPGEVSALVTIDGTVPEDFAVAPTIGAGQRLLSVTGWARWMIALNPAITAPSAPVGVYSEREIEQIRLMTIWNYANPAIIDENNRSAENFDAVAGMSYPAELPVLAFLSQQLIDTNGQWLPAHEQQLEPLDRSELVVLDGGHYLHWTHSEEMAESLNRFIR